MVSTFFNGASPLLTTLIWNFLIARWQSPPGTPGEAVPTTLDLPYFLWNSTKIFLLLVELQRQQGNILLHRVCGRCFSQVSHYVTSTSLKGPQVVKKPTGIWVHPQSFQLTYPLCNLINWWHSITLNYQILDLYCTIMLIIRCHVELHILWYICMHR